MKLGVPWRVKGIRPDARETAREAARRAGMSVGEWLNTVIIDSADEEGIRPRRRAYADDEDDFSEDDNLFGVHERLDELTRQLERMNRGGAARRAGDVPHGDRDNLADAIARLDRRLDQFITGGRVSPGNEQRATSTPGDPWAAGMDEAIAQISARQRALDADPNAPTPPAGAPARMPAQNLSGLEQHLRHITAQIETLRAPSGLEEGIAALRTSLAEIARTLTEAMPRRAIDALENEVRALAGRLDNSRNAGVDASTLSAVERGLAEIRDTLRGLTPAENLSGFYEAVRNLAQKIDLLSSTTPDPGAFHQLEAAISALRGIVTHVASNEALAQLTGEVQNLAGKIDQVATSTGGNALAVLEKRVAHIADALEARAQNGGSVPPQLEAVIKGLSDKIERIQMGGGDQVALVNFEDRVVKLVEKLDASGARFGQLEAIERGLADLLVHMEAQRAGSAAGASSNADGLQRDLARTQTSLEAVHGTLGHVVDRLATLESDMRGGQPRPAPKMPQAAALAAPRPAAVTPPPPDRATAAAQAAAAMARANPKTARSPIDPSLPPDHPLEPGVGAGRGRPSASAADRIAASEAALGTAKPPVIPDPGGKSNFIAAARRAAQAATADPTPADLRAAAAHQNLPEEKPGKTLAQRVRSLFVGTSVILLVGGSLRIAANLSDPADSAGGAPPPTKAQAELSSRNTQTASADAARKATGTSARPEINTVEGRPTEVTGSLPMQAPSSAPSLQPTTSLPLLPGSRTPPRADKLPATIGGPALRTAAASGNAVAEYEVGVRYAEGRGVAVNSAEAARWLELSAQRGLAPAQFRLASLYEKGIGVKKDIETARRLYKAAAEQGNAKAMHNLAVLYAEGAAVKPDYRTAAQWFRLAADHGVSDSQYNLAILYARGIGIDQNLSESYKWFSLAASQGDQEAGKKRDEVGKRLDPQALAAARVAAQAFMPQAQPEAATTAKPPPEGWDASAADPAPAAKPKPRAGAPVRLGSR